MHELSIVEALINQVRRHAPAGGRVVAVRVEIGARQSIDEDSFRFAWGAMTASTELEGALLEAKVLPWRIECDQCGRIGAAADPLQRCGRCGSEQTRASGSDDLRLLSIEVADAVAAEGAFSECPS